MKEYPQAERLPSAFSLFRPSYEALMVNITTILVLMGVPMGLAFLGGLFLDEPGAPVTAASALFFVVALFFGLLAAPALPYVQLKSVKGKEVDFQEAFSVGLDHFWRFYGLSILITLTVLGGLILFIVPGLFMIRRYLLATFYMYDRKLSIREAMSESAEDSLPFSYAIWGLLGVQLLIGLPGVFPPLALFAGLLGVVYSCAPAVRYFEIKNIVHPAHHKSKAASSPSVEE